MSRNRRNKPGDKIDDSWLLPYADLLTLLLALFIVLFAMSEVDARKFEKLASIFQAEFSNGVGIVDDGINIEPQETPVELEDDRDEEEQKDESAEVDDLEQLGAQEYRKLESIQKRIEEYIALNSLTETLGTKLTGEGLLITVRTDVTFDSGSAKVKPNGVEIAREIAVFLNTDPPHEIVVNGHADDRPMKNEEFASNWELSAMRAIQFMYLLLEDTALDPKWFSARGYGEYQPVVPNTSEANRAMNRRVEVLIQPNYDIEAEIQ